MLSLYFSNSMVEILKPSVGLMSLRAWSADASGERRRATIVDFPAASRPKNRMRSCLSFSRCFLRMVYRPILQGGSPWSLGLTVEIGCV